MPYARTTFDHQTSVALVAAFDAYMSAASSADRVVGFSAAWGQSYRVSLTLDQGAGNAIASKLRLKAFPAQSIQSANAALALFAASNPGWYVSPGILVVQEGARKTDSVTVLAAYSSDGSASANWYPDESAGGKHAPSHGSGGSDRLEWDADPVSIGTSQNTPAPSATNAGYLNRTVTNTLDLALSDGSTWTSVTRQAGQGDRFTNQTVLEESRPSWASAAAVAYGNGLFVVVSGGDGLATVAVSPDGLSWTYSKGLPVDGRIAGVAYGNGIFMAVQGCEGGYANGNAWTSVDGVAWTSHPIPRNIRPAFLSFANGRFWVGGESHAYSQPELTTTLISTTDGTDWLDTNVVVGAVTSVAYGNGVYVATMYGGNRASTVFTSTDGVSWTARYTQFVTSGSNWISSAFGAGRFVVVGNAGTYNCMTSPDGITWTPRTMPTASVRGVAYADGQFIAVGEASSPALGTGYRAATSPDGITWTARHIGGEGYTSVGYGNGVYVVVGQSAITRSTDTITWQVQTPQAPFNIIYTSMCYGNGRFVGVGSNSTGNQVTTSSDGIRWSNQVTPTRTWNGVAFGAGVFVAVASSGTGNRVMTSPDGLTWTIRTSAEDNSWTRVCFGNGLFVAVAQSGTGNRVMTSPDGFAWTIQTSAADVVWRDVTWSAAAGLFIAVASSGTAAQQIMTSPNGTTWTSRTASASGTWRTVRASGAVIVVLGDSGTIRAMTSPDGITWTSRTILDQAWRDCLWDGAQFVAVASQTSTAQTNRVATSPDGITWTSRQSAAGGDGQWTCVAYDGVGTYAALAEGGNSDGVMISTNGARTWQGVGYPASTVTDAVYGNGVWVAMANNGSGGRPLLVSSDGVSWRQVQATTAVFVSVAFGNGVFVAIGQQSTTRVMTSVDGVTWTFRTAAADITWQAVRFYAGMFIACASTGSVTGTDGNRIMTSRDGVTWTSRATPRCGGVDGSWRHVIYGGGQYVAVGNNTLAAGGGSACVMTSPNGLTWTRRQPSLAAAWNNVAYGNGVYVAVGTSGVVMSSPDGITWTTRSAAAANNWNGVVYGNGLFVAVASSGTNNRVMTSPDGVVWTARTSAANIDWLSVAYGNGLFVAVAGSGTNNRVMTSPNGIAWTIRTSAADNTWTDITYGNGLFVAVATSGTGNRVMTSPDGIVWTSRTSAADNPWEGITYGNGLFVAVATAGGTGRVMTSPDGIVWTTRVSSQAQQRSVAYNNGMFVSVNDNSGSSNAEWSIDGKVWVQAHTPAEPQWRAVGYLNGRWVATAGVFDHSLANSMYSDDNGVTWTAAPLTATSDGSHGSTCIATGGGRTIIMGARPFYSDDGGITWGQLPGETVTGVSTVVGGTNLIYANGRFVGLGNGTSTTPIVTSTDGGMSWTYPLTPQVAAGWRALCYGNGIFVAINVTAPSAVGQVLTSPDGITWTPRTSAANIGWFSVAYGAGRFVAVARANASSGFGSSLFMTSVDGVTWSLLTLPDVFIQIWSGITYANGIFVAVSSGSMGQVDPLGGRAGMAATSADGLSWSIRPSADIERSWAQPVYGGGVWMAKSISGPGGPAGLMRSLDGINWTMVPFGDTLLYNWSAIQWTGSLFVAFTSGASFIGGNVFTSPDGLAWTQRATPTASTLSAPLGTQMSYADGALYAVSNAAVGATPYPFYRTTDGINWVGQTCVDFSGQDIPFRGIAYGRGVLVATPTSASTTRYGSIAVNRAGSWEMQYGNAQFGGKSYNSSAYANGQFVATSSSSVAARITTSGSATVIQTSPDHGHDQLPRMEVVETLAAQGAYVDAVVRVVAVNAGSTVLSNSIQTIILDPAANIASYTLTMPANPAQGQVVCVSGGSFAITSLTLTPNAGQTMGTWYASIGLPTGMAFTMSFSNGVWYGGAGIESLNGALPFGPDTLTRTGPEVCPYSGVTMLTNQICTRPLQIGVVSSLLYLANPATTNICTVMSANAGASSNTLSVISRTIVEDTSANQHRATGNNFTLTNGAQYHMAVKVARAAGTRHAAFYVDYGTVNRGGFIINMDTGALTSAATGTGTTTDAYSIAVPGGWIVRCRISSAAWGGVVTPVLRISSSPTSLVTYTGDGTSGIVFSGHTITLATNTAPPPLIGEAAVNTADSIRRVILDFLPSGSPRLLQAQTWHWRVMLEGHTIGSMGHVSGQLARHWDSTNYVAYDNTGDRRATASITDSAGAQALTPPFGSCPDTSNILVAYALTYEPGVAMKLYRNGVLIVTDNAVGTSLTAWTQAIYFGQNAALIRALSGWISPIFAEFGVARTANEIASLPIGYVGAGAESLYGASAFVPDTIGSVGAPRVSQYSGLTVAATDPITRPLTIGAVSSMMWLCQAGATNDQPNSTAYNSSWTKIGTTAVAATGPSGSGDAFELTQGSGATDIVASGAITIVAGSTRTIAFEIKGISGADWFRIAPRNNSGLNGTSAWVNLTTGAAGAHSANGTGTPVSLIVSPLPNGWWMVRATLIYDATSTSVLINCGIVSGNSSNTRAAGVYRLRHCTFTTGPVPVSSIPTAGSAASITADNIRRAALDFLPAGSPRLTQPQTWHWRVMLEGNSIGATGHVSGVTARHWDHNSATIAFYQPGAQLAQANVTDSSGVQTVPGTAADVAGVLVAYALTYEPGVALKLYRNGVLIAQDLTVGASLIAWSQPLYFGNIAALTRALSGWVSPVFAEFGVARTQVEIAAIPVGNVP